MSSLLVKKFGAALGAVVLSLTLSTLSHADCRDAYKKEAKSTIYDKNVQVISGASAVVFAFSPVASGITSAGAAVSSTEAFISKRNAEAMLKVINQAELGDGPDLRAFQEKLEEKAKRRLDVKTVNDVILSANDASEFCRPDEDLADPDEAMNRLLESYL